MYSDQLRELFHSRAHAGKLEDATHYGEAGTPGHGPYMQLWLRVVEGVVVTARFKSFGCPAALACGEAVAAWCEGKAMGMLAGVTGTDVTGWVGGVPEGKEHCPELGARALVSLREKRI